MENIKGQTSIDDFLGELLQQQPARKPKTPKPATSKITKETRRESHEKTDATRLKEKVLEVLEGKELTAREIAEEMHRRGYIAYPARAVIQPRITELVQAEWLVAAGKKKDKQTQREVAVYRVVLHV